MKRQTSRVVRWVPPFALVVSVVSVADAAPRVRIEPATAFKATDTVELDGGEKVSAKRYNDEINQLQEALETDGVSLRKADHRPPTKKLYAFPNTPQENQRDKAALVSKLGQLKAVEVGGFNALRKKRATVVKNMAVTPLSPKTTRALPSKGDVTPDEDDGLDVTFEQTLGANNRASIYVGFALKDTGETDKVGCDATLDGGVYVFGDKKQLVKLSASGKIGGGTVSGSLDLFLLGKSVDGFPKRGSAPNAAMNKAIAPPAAKMKYGWGPLSINVEGSITGEFRMSGLNTQEAASPAQRGKCAVSVEPLVRASAKASASVSAIAYKVGVEGRISLIDMKTPASASVMVAGDPAIMTEDFTAHVNATFLDGDVAFFVKTRIPQKNEHWWDLDWDQVYRKVLFDWDGLSLDSKLASFKGKRSKV